MLLVLVWIKDKLPNWLLYVHQKPLQLSGNCEALENRKVCSSSSVFIKIHGNGIIIIKSRLLIERLQSQWL